MDIFDKKKRSEVMSKVSQRDTPLEVVVRKFLYANGFRYRKNYKKLPGSPDIALTRLKVAVFIHGCFWHGHECKSARLPKSNAKFWSDKIAANKTRDLRKKEMLENMGWNVIEIWQCEISREQDKEAVLSSLLKTLKQYKQV
jgi:DNA mismatch endonuclease (patch repair protein)